MDQLLGQTLNNRFRLDALLGQGGMGAVFKAYDTKLKVDRAIKVMHPQYVQSVTFRQRFLREAQAAAGMNHPGIVKVHDYSEQPPYLFIVMQYIPGGNLRQLLDKMRAANQSIALTEVVQFTRQICLTLHYLHQKGVLHRDIKPSNIMIDATPTETLPYQPVLTDLGLAKLVDESALTVDGTSLGTPAYMSPEQAKGEPADARSDIYSTGILLYEMTTGALPFPIQNFADALHYHVGVQPPSPQALRPGLPSLFVQVIQQALAKEPAKRFADARAMAEALALVLPVMPRDLTPPTEERAASLYTEYQQSLLQPPKGAWSDDFPTPPSDATQDSIAIRASDGAIRTIPITARELTIGRTSDNTIVLDDPIVSRHHARIVFDGAAYNVIDLKSVNGTYLTDARLLDGVPAAWSPDSPLRIGDHTLRLQLTKRASVSPDETVHADKSESVRAAVTLETIELHVEPGSSVTATAVILNQSQRVDQFQMNVIGIPANWIAGALPLMNLMPQTSRTVSLAIQPPRSPQSRAGRYPLTVQVTSRNDASQVAEAKGTLIVADFQQFQAELHPQRQSGLAEGKFRLLVKNLGNADLTIDLAALDPEEMCVYTFDSPSVTLGAGEERTVQLVVRPKVPLHQEQPRCHPFLVTVRPTAAAHLAQQIQAEWVHVPPVFDLTAQPQSVSGVDEGVFTVTIANRGEADLGATLEATDANGACTCTFMPAQVAVSAGQEQSARLVVRSQSPAPIEKARDHSLTIVARPAGSPKGARQVQATWQQTPVKPVSLPKPEDRGIPESVVVPKPQRKPRRFLGILTFLVLAVIFFFFGVWLGSTAPLIWAEVVWIIGLIISIWIARKVWRGPKE